MTTVVEYLEVALEGQMDAEMYKHLVDTHVRAKELIAAVESSEERLGLERV